MKATTFSALAEPNRLHIVELLARQPLTIGELAARLQLRQPQVSKHVRILSEAGIVEVEAVANRRICTLRAEPFEELDGWLRTYRQLWEDRFDRLGDYLQQLQHDASDPSPTDKADTSTHPDQEESP
ncbi:transcriptional regulator [Deinococcus phoenicis]|uniref:Transcriptional regulator n=1 Tax=Deinococcus phoenicis TaxID=1476583 RepID=A0A016QUW8_9DEIO|nr:metalloregulator ArsR/SmtB family transcription factor [Deinococcus phoenicis]EYB69549.1 transcriptional regulator [Deinococcus phoenicis]